MYRTNRPKADTFHVEKLALRTSCVENETFKLKLTDALRLRFSKGRCVFNILNPDMGDDPFTDKAKQFLVYITAIENPLRQVTEVRHYLLVFFNMLFQLRIAMLPQERFLKSEVLFYIGIKRIQGIECGSESLPFFDPKFEPIQACDQLRMLFINFLNTNMGQ